MSYYWMHQTRIGEARIEPALNNRWNAKLTGEFLGNYATAEHALDDLLGGHVFSHSSGVDTSTLGFPDELSEWQRVRFR
jgi:hypothetical protein